MDFEKQARLLELMAQESSPGLIPYRAFAGEPPEREERFVKAANALMVAVSCGDERAAQKAERELEGAQESDLEPLAENMLGALTPGASGAMCGWLAISGWISRAQRAADRRGGAALEGKAQWLTGRLALEGNRAGLDALVDAGAVEVEEALARCALDKKGPLCLHFANRMRSAGIAPSEEAASLVCSSLSAMFPRLSPRAPHPMQEHLTAWAERMDQRSRSRAWRAAVEFERPELMAALLRAGLALDEWRLTDASNWGSGFPKLLEFAVERSAAARGEGGGVALRALMLVEAIADDKTRLDPRCFASLGFEALKAVKKLGFDLGARTEQGNTALHLALGPGGRRPRGAELKKMGALLGSLWHIKNAKGDSPLDLLSPEEQSALAPGLAEFEQKEMKKSAGRKPAAKAKSAARAL